LTLQKTKNITQIELTQVMRVEQAAVSKIERREDLHLSTLRHYIEALGGELKLIASFPEGDICVQPTGIPSLKNQ